MNQVRPDHESVTASRVVRSRRLTIASWLFFAGCAIVAYRVFATESAVPMPVATPDPVEPKSPSGSADPRSIDSGSRQPTEAATADASTSDPTSAPSAGAVPDRAWMELRRDVRTLTDLGIPRNRRVSAEQQEAIRAAIEEYRPLISGAWFRENERRGELHMRLMEEGKVETYPTREAIRPAGRGEMISSGYFDHPSAGTPGVEEHVVTRVFIADDEVLYNAGRDLHAARNGLAAVIQDILGHPLVDHTRREQTTR